ncbi:MAG: restriction endonuclease subunit S [Spirochaetaceae bacterium]|nr:restriction endonuclease subunit S [Spirochaetaceae bacterium]
MKFKYLFDRLTRRNTIGNTNVMTVSARNGLINQESFFNKSIASEDLSGYYLLECGDFAYNKSYSDGYNFGAFKQLTCCDCGVVSPLYICFSVSEKNKCPEFYAHYFESCLLDREIKAFAQEGARNHGLLNIAIGDFFSMPVPLPPLPEQRAIAKILTAADKLIAVKDRLIAAKRRQKRWLMQNLLTGKVRLPGFGGEWETVRVDELFTILSSLPLSRSELTEMGHCYLHYGDIHKMQRFCVDVCSYFDKPRAKVADPKNDVLLLDGDIVCVNASEDYDGVCKYVTIKNNDNIPFISGLHTIHLRSTNTKIDNAFKEFCFQNPIVRKQMLGLSTGMKVYGLSKVAILKLRIPLPPLPEQRAIAQILATADREIELLTRGLEQHKLYKKYLTQQLLTGKIQVKGTAQ